MWPSSKVCLICEMLPEFSAVQRDGMQKMGILLLERHRVDAEILEDIFKEHAVAATRETPTTLKVDPEELQQRLETDISLTTELPVLPQVYNRIMKLSRDPTSGMAEWTEAVETDPLSSAMILRRARSPVYGFRDKIEDVNRAVTLIGKDAVKDLVASAALKSALKSISDTNFNIEDFWSHSAAVGLAARMLVLPFDGSDWNRDEKRFHDEWQPDEPVVDRLKEFDLARRFGLTEDEDPFVGGMMHDIGKVAMTCAYPGLWSLILEGISDAQNKISMRDAEALLTAAADHTHVGAILAKNWELGPQLTRAVERHHRPPSDDVYARLICLADFIGAAVYPFPRDAVFPHVLQVQRLAGSADPVVALKDDEREALENNFLPPNLLETLDLDLDAVLGLGAVLAPGVQQLTEGIRRSLGTDD